MSEAALLEKIKRIPPAYQQEIADFIDFLLEKKIKKNPLPIDRSSTLGIFRGKITMKSNFDDPVEGMEEYM